jgi:hypothetical protein
MSMHTLDAPRCIVLHQSHHATTGFIRQLHVQSAFRARCRLDASRLSATWQEPARQAHPSDSNGSTQQSARMRQASFVCSYWIRA